MQGPHDRHHHHPPRLSRAALLALLALLLAAPAQAARFAPLPSPSAPLSPRPPLGGGATSSGEGVGHRVDAETRVEVSVDATGAPFAVDATQRLDVRVKGDYLFTIGAPVESVRAAPGSASTPGFRTGEILWAGFDPGRRILAARATLEPRTAAPSLPLRLVVSGGRTTLVNATRVTVGTFRARALPRSLAVAVAGLRAANAVGIPAPGGVARVTGTPTTARTTVEALLRVRGTVGTRRVSVRLGGDAVVDGIGPVHLTVTVLLPPIPERLPRDGAAAFALASRLSLETARARQYLQFLGNPDAQGRSATTFVYRTGNRPVVAAPQVVVVRGGRSWVETLLVAAGVVALAWGALAAWARS